MYLNVASKFRQSQDSASRLDFEIWKINLSIVISNIQNISKQLFFEVGIQTYAISEILTEKMCAVSTNPNNCCCTFFIVNCYLRIYVSIKMAFFVVNIKISNMVWRKKNDRHPSIKKVIEKSGFLMVNCQSSTKSSCKFQIPLILIINAYGTFWQFWN